VSDFLADTLPKFSQIFTSIAIFFAVLLLLFGAAGRVNGKAQRPLAILIFFGPAAILLLFGLVSPAIQTIIYSFKDADSISYVGFDNYTWMIQDESIRTVLFNTILWVIITPIVTTAIGLALAVLLDRMKHESLPKSLIFMPMAISFVGASIIWRFVYDYAKDGYPQTGLLTNLVTLVGREPHNWMLEKPLNSLLLMVIFIWVQTGFAMVILSAAIKAVPSDIVEASALDGASGWKLFRNITFPTVRSTFIVVLATNVVGALKLFDIVQTMTGGNFGTNVLANEMYAQVFVQFNQGRGSALAVALFLLVAPILVYNIVHLKRERQH
jgi:alpha-glucoside transport system permease protein